MDLPLIEDFHSLFLNDTPLLDVRSPVEFSQGAFPHSENFPLLNDRERESVGIQYKNLGQEEAIRLGHKLIQGEIRQARIQAWLNFIQRHPQAVLYCFRGGMRSRISQQWIYDTSGIACPRVKGGYKALRRFLIDQLEISAESIQPILLGGRTGIGKTVLLQQLQQQVDLEGIFHHRGSVFGKHVTPQPTQISIENQLSIELLKFRHQHILQLVFEDEAANIGSRRIPVDLYHKMQQSPLIQLEASVQERVEITFNEYIIQALAEHFHFYGHELGFDQWSQQLHQSFDKIQRRLGGERYRKLKALLEQALQEQLRSGDNSLHRAWIESLLVDYYDPMYDYQFSKKQHRVVFRGGHDDVLDFLHHHYQIK